MAARFCSSCGKPVGSDTRFCPSCGATLAQQSAPAVNPQAPNYPAYQPPYQPTPRRSNTGVIIAVVVIVVVVVAILGGILATNYENVLRTATTPHSFNIVNGLVTVPAGSYEYYQFVVPSGATSVTVNGQFTASGGSGNDIVVSVQDETNFVNWRNGHSSTAYYDSGQVTTATVSATLPGPGTYYLVYSNNFSVISSKNVQTTVNLNYQG